jgi:hypothetical protein
MNLSGKANSLGQVVLQKFAAPKDKFDFLSLP